MASYTNGVVSCRQAVAAGVRKDQGATLSRSLRRANNALVEDIDRARRHLDSLRELFTRHSGEADARALRCLITLCRAATLCTEDDYCRDKLTAVEEQGAELFTHGGHRRLSPDFLRQRILDALELLESRLYSLARSVARVEVHPV